MEDWSYRKGYLLQRDQKSDVNGLPQGMHGFNITSTESWKY